MSIWCKARRVEQVGQLAEVKFRRQFDKLISMFDTVINNASTMQLSHFTQIMDLISQGLVVARIGEQHVVRKWARSTFATFFGTRPDLAFLFQQAQSRGQFDQAPSARHPNEA